MHEGSAAVENTQTHRNPQGCCLKRHGHAARDGPCGGSPRQLGLIGVAISLLAGVLGHYIRRSNPNSLPSYSESWMFLRI